MKGDVEGRAPGTSFGGDAPRLELGLKNGELIVGAGENGEVRSLAVMEQALDVLGYERGLLALIGKAPHQHWGARGLVAVAVVDLVCRVQGGGAGAHHLGRASVIGLETDDGDARIVMFDLGQQARVGTVPPVNGLARVAHEAQVRAVGADGFEHGVLQGVEVLGFVDEQVAKPPAHSLCPCGVGDHRLEHTCEQVVEVDHPTPLLELGIGGHQIGETSRWYGAATAKGPGGALVLLWGHESGARPVEVGHGGHGVELQAELGEALAHQSDAVVRHLGWWLVVGLRAIPQEPQCDTVEGAGLDRVAQVEPAEPSLELSGGIASEREGKNVAW